MKFTLETLDISGSHLTEHCLEMLHQIMLKRKIKNTLFLHSCVFMAQDVKSVGKLLREMERSKIIVEPQKLSLSWEDGPRFQKLDTTGERKSLLQTQSKSAIARTEKLDRVALSSQTESQDSGLGESNITLGAEDMSLLGPLKKFPSTLSLQPKTIARKRLIAREGFESTQSLDVEQQRKCKSPRPSPIFEGDIMEDFGSVFLHDRHSFESVSGLDSPRVLSCPFSADIGPEGGEIIVFDCIIKFPEDSFEQTTKVWGNLKIDPSKCPPGYISITPMLRLKSRRRSRRPVTIKMTSWCVNDGTHSDYYVEVLHFSDNCETWDVIAEIPFGVEREFEFETPTFSGFMIVLREFFFGPRLYFIEGSLYDDNDANFTFLFHLKSSFLAHIFSKIKSLECRGERRLQFNVLKAKFNDKITGSLFAKNVTFAHEGRLSFIVDDEFIRNQNWRKLHTCVTEESAPERPLIILCRIQQNAKIVQADCTFRYSEHEPDKKVYIDNKRVTANTVAMDRAQVTLPSFFSHPASIVVAYLGVFVLLALYHLFFGF